MKKFGQLLCMTLLSFGMISLYGPSAAAYNYGNFSSETLVKKAWEAFEEGEIEAVLAYTNKCIEMYADLARDMQENLNGYVEGSDEEISAKWALNDVATSYFIRGESYRQAGMMEKAAVEFKTLITDYSYGQCWDTGKWFWKPAEAAQEKLVAMASGRMIEGGYSSADLTAKAWQAKAENDVDAVKMYTDKVLELYAENARTMQDSLTDFPEGSDEEVFKYWALNDVGTSLFIRAEVLKEAGYLEEAKEAYSVLVNEFSYAQCYDPPPNGWFWKPAEAAFDTLVAMGE